jgi:hypothetical protein
MFDDDFLEEDMFDEEVSNDSSDYDDAQYILELMEMGMDTCEEAVNALDVLMRLNNKLGGSEVTGVNHEVLLAYKTIFERVIPDLITGENLEYAIQTVKQSLNTSDKVAKDYVDNKRTMILEAIENNNKNN